MNDRLYKDPSQNPYFLSWSRDFFTDAFFESNLCSLLGGLVSTMAYERDENYINYAIEQLEKEKFIRDSKYFGK